MTATNAYDELAGRRLDNGRGYDKRSVEKFRAHALDVVDGLLRKVTELEDRLTAGSSPALSGDEAELLHAFRHADSSQRRDALAVLERSLRLTRPQTDDERAPELESVVATELDDWLLGFGEPVAPPPVGPRSSAVREPALRLPLRVAPVERSPRPPTPPTPWGGWVD